MSDLATQEERHEVALTGATGFIGSHVLTELQEHDHEVIALVRDDAQAGVVAARGATPRVVDLYDRDALVSLLSNADGAIHTASPGDATSADLDSAVVDAVLDAFVGTGRPYLHISGVWVYGPNSSISEKSPLNPPALVSWKEPIESRVLGARDMRGVENPTVAELTEAAAVAAGARGAVPGSDDEARARLGDYFAEVLLLDQSTDATTARAEFDWAPTHTGLVDEFRKGSYRNATAG